MKKLLSAALAAALCLTMALPAAAARDNEIVKFRKNGRPQDYFPESDTFLIEDPNDYSLYLMDAKTGKVRYDFNGDKSVGEFWYPDGYMTVERTRRENGSTVRDTIIVDTAGREVLTIPAGRYDSVYDVIDGMIMVRKENDTQGSWWSAGSKYGFLNLKGEEVIPCQYSYANNFSEGLTCARDENGTHVIDKTGKIVGEAPEGATAENEFSDGLVAVSVRTMDPEAGMVTSSGYMDRTGKMVIPARYDMVEDFENGYGVVYNFDENYDTQYGLVDKTGREIIPCQYGSLYLSDDGKYARASKQVGDEYFEGVVETATGKVTVPFRYSWLRSVRSGVVAVQQPDGDKRWGLVDAATGRQLIPHAYTDMGQSLDGKMIWANDITARGFMLDIATGREIKLTANDLSVADVYQNHYVIELAENSFGLIPIEEQPSSWAKAFIDTARQKNILPESFESRYTANCSRAEFCELAVKLYETSKGVISERKTFTDTTDVNVEKMAGLGVIKGMGDGIFAPDQNLTREQASAILSNLAKALGKELPAAEPAFADNGKISKWAKAFVGQVKAADIMNGVGGNQFAPQSPYTREQCVITMVKLADR